MVVPSFVPQDPQVLPQNHLLIQNGIVQNIELAQNPGEMERILLMMRETQTEMAILKEVMVLLFKELFIKNAF